MMSEQENFDELIRQKFAEKEFIFNEENWEKAEKKIDSVRRFSKISWWSAIFIIGLVSGIIGTLLFVGKINNNDTKNITDVNLQKEKENKSIHLNKGNSLDENQSSTNSNQLKKNAVSQIEVEKENTPEAKNSTTYNEHRGSETIISNPELVKENLSNGKTVSSNESDNRLSSTNKENKISNKESNLHMQDKTSTTKNQFLKKELKEPEVAANEVSQKNRKNNIVEKKSQKNNLVPSLSQIVQEDKSSNQPQTLALAPTPKGEVNSYSETNAANQSQTIVLDATQKSEVKNNSENKSADQPQTNAIEATPKIEAKSNSENKTSDQLQTSTLEATPKSEAKNNIVTNTSEQSETKPLAVESVKPKLDSSVVSAQNNLIAPPPPVLGGLASATVISVDAGTNFEFGWKYADAAEARGFNPILGIGITHYINQKWSLYSGIQYGSIAYLNVSQKDFSNITYGFGSTSIDTVIDTKFLHYAVVPIMFEYHFNDKNALSIGGSVSYLINAKSKVTINTTTVSAMITDSAEVSSTSKTETGYYANAFNKWDASLAVGYRRRLSKKINVSAIANFGLLDIKNNAFFSQENFERNSGLKIILSYNLFDF